MGVLYEAICTGVSLSLMFGAYGCKKKETPPERVLNLSSAIFPEVSRSYTGVIKLGKEQKTCRYVTIGCWNEGKDRWLTIAVYYTGLDSQLEATIDGYLLDNNYKQAEEDLRKSRLKTSVYWDYRADGLRKRGYDTLMRRNGKFSLVPTSKLSKNELKKLNEEYWALLKTITPILEEKCVPILLEAITNQLLSNQKD